MRSRLRKILTWLLLSVVVVIFVAVVGEFFIEVARDKGWYDKAGERWDRLVSDLTLFLTSDAVLYPLTFLGGVVGGMWADAFLARREALGPAPQSNIDSNTANADSVMLSAAEAERLRRLANKIEAEEQERRNAAVLEMIEQTRRPREPRRSLMTGPYGYYIGDLSKIEKAIVELGVSPEIVSEHVRRATEKITSNVSYYILTGDDGKYWQSEGEKQTWHVINATLNSLAEIVKDLPSFQRRSKPQGVGTNRL